AKRRQSNPLRCGVESGVPPRRHGDHRFSIPRPHRGSRRGRARRGSNAPPNKCGTDDNRESPAMLLVQDLLREGCTICAYDPAAMERAQEVLKSGVEFATDSYQAAKGADALL